MPTADADYFRMERHDQLELAYWARLARIDRAAFEAATGIAASLDGAPLPGSGPQDALND